ncbi:hypothetical protein GRF29_69g1136600 [Pseudopithomyces chartarum]|uniref:2'-5' RNA ligase family protein n=1 Tax=Pseudopithomyces chartarum TaxID=1892770 RepID=A0AAN6RH61_9PLEO|nr:hypothetical protein GRF29_69g1136600 [Pseudopithomyces chartarum]
MPKIDLAPPLPSFLSYKSALVLLPPRAIALPIEAVRGNHDRHFKRWPPHINLIWPFLAQPSTAEPGRAHRTLKDEIRSRIQRATKDIRSFHMNLMADHPGTFQMSKTFTNVHLKPSTDSVEKLQAALQAEFAECDYDKRPFVPHLSLGQVKSAFRLEQLRTRLRESIADHLEPGLDPRLEWHVDAVLVLERKDYNDRFKVVGTIELDRE